MTITELNGNLILKNIKNFDAAQTLDCGQAFRWSCDADGIWSGIAFGKFLRIKTDNDTAILYNTTMHDFDKIWKNYFDLDRDYGCILESISTHPILNKAGLYSAGIRILKQDPWETLCSFIISQNNNIPRIKGIVERLCMTFGEKTDGGYTFPTAERLCNLTIDDLAPLRSGFRAKYILDAAQKVARGEVDLNSLYTLPYIQARDELIKIKGVGEKVADCTLLFGLGHIEAFPKDVWIKRVMANHFDGVLPECAVPSAGIVQQYLFYYARSGELD